ncbi:hypothetical protein BpHYR1_009450, partial [Brachionus plicatilis]
MDSLKSNATAMEFTTSKLISMLLEKLFEQLKFKLSIPKWTVVIGIMVMLAVLWTFVKWSKKSSHNFWFTLIYSPIKWLTRTKPHYPLPWIKHFGGYAIRLNDKTGALLTLIEDECLAKLEQFILNHNPHASYDEIKDTLRKLYGKDNQYQDPLIEFAARKQLPNGNIYKYFSELEFLAEAAHPEQPYTALEPIVVDRFIRGIHDIKIKQELCKPPTCHTLKDALQKTYELEEGLQDTSSKGLFLLVGLLKSVFQRVTNVASKVLDGFIYCPKIVVADGAEAITNDFSSAFSSFFERR